MDKELSPHRNRARFLSNFPFLDLIFRINSNPTTTLRNICFIIKMFHDISSWVRAPWGLHKTHIDLKLVLPD